MYPKTLYKVTEEVSILLPIYIIPLAVALCAFLIYRHVTEETVGVMAVAIAAILVILGLILAPWQLQLVGALALVLDRFQLLKARG